MMAFKLPEKKPNPPDDPEALFRDLRKKTVPGLLSHQADVLRSYLLVHATYADIALQLPTGSGKTLVGLLIAEWRRRKYGERVVYLCPTRQLVNQVAQQAATKYGIDLHAFIGSRAQYDASASADWQNAEAIAVTTYSSLFNTNPFFDEPNLIILDDAHSAENYVSAFWSLLIERSNPEQEPGFTALAGVVSRFLPPSDRSRLAGDSKDAAERQWVEKLPTPVLQSAAPEIVALLDEHTKGIALRYTWSLLRDSLHACHLYISRRAILIRPLIPPSNTHLPFSGAKQRVYMSATLGAGGDLERVTGRQPIHKIPVPLGWDKQGIGRRFFLMPKRSLDDAEAERFAMEAIKLAGRALYLVPDDYSGDAADKAIVALRAGMAQQTLAATKELADAAPAELSYQYALWNGDFVAALEQCRAVIGKLNHADLRGYRALWLYLAGSSAWLAHRAGQLDSDEIAKDYFRKAQAAAPVLRWLVGLGTEKTAATPPPPVHPELIAMVERLETVLENMGTVHDRKYDAEESAILAGLLQDLDGKLFERGHKRLGDFLGYSAGSSAEEAAPDPWWIADDSFCFVFEDHAEGKPDTIFSVAKARQAALHPEWIRLNVPELSQAEIFPILITPCTRTTKGAIPFLKQVHYWHLEEFRAWMKNALQVLRDIRREFAGPGNLGWRATAVDRLRAANIGPRELRQMLLKTAANSMQVISAKEEESA